MARFQTRDHVPPIHIFIHPWRRSDTDGQDYDVDDAYIAADDGSEFGGSDDGPATGAVPARWASTVLRTPGLSPVEFCCLNTAGTLTALSMENKVPTVFDCVLCVAVGSSVDLFIDIFLPLPLRGKCWCRMTQLPAITFTHEFDIVCCGVCVVVHRTSGVGGECIDGRPARRARRSSLARHGRRLCLASTGHAHHRLG